GEVGRRYPGGADDDLGQSLVQAQGHAQRIGKGAGDAVDIEQSGHLGLAGRAIQSLADVEDKVPAIAGGQSLDQLAEVADTVRFMAELPQRPLDGVDGVGTVELGGVLLAVAGRQVLLAQVIRQTDLHDPLTSSRRTSSYSCRCQRWASAKFISNSSMSV